MAKTTPEATKPTAPTAMRMTLAAVGEWSLVTNHARVLVCIARDPGAPLCEFAATLSITKWSVFGIVTDLTAAGYVLKNKDGRRNCYPDPGSRAVKKRRRPRQDDR